MLVRDLFESPSLPSTLNAISTDISTKILPLYHEIDIMLDRMIEKNGNSNGFGFVAGGTKSRWMGNNWNRMLDELFDLGRQSGPVGSALLTYLNRTRPTQFKEITQQLPLHLKRIAQAKNDKRLADLCDSWTTTDKKLQDKFKAHQEKEEKKSKTATVTAKAKPTSSLPQQNVKVEQIVNDVLSKLPSGVAGEIRVVLARSTNKIQDLMQELARRGITPRV